MTLYVYKIGSKVPNATIENVTSYTSDTVLTFDGSVCNCFADDVELSSLPDCSETLRADYRKAHEISQLDRMEAQLTYTAMMSDTLLEV